MFVFIKDELYTKFKEDEELADIIVDALISFAHSGEHVELLREWL